MPKIQLSCETCTIQFYRWPSQRKNRDFCSITCLSTAARKSGTSRALARTVGLIQPIDYKLVALTKGQVAKVSNEDFESLITRSWYMDTAQYAGGRCAPRLMHRYVFEVLMGQAVPEGMVIDHANRDTLDNRRENLRLATPSQNTANSAGQQNTTSRYKRVCWSIWHQGWQVNITKDGRQFDLGIYDDEIEAAYIYDQFALALFGEFAYFNLIDN